MPISYIDLSIIFYGQTCRQTVVNLWTLFEKFIDKIIQVYRQLFFCNGQTFVCDFKGPLIDKFPYGQTHFCLPMQDIQDKKVIKLILKEAEYHNVKPFHNKLYNLVNNKIYGDDIHLHKILTADILHTFIKGPIEQIVSFTLVIFECLGNIDPKYKDLMAKLDLMLKVFPTKEALKPHRDCRFTEGISIFVKNKTKRSNSSGFMTSLEG